jgi:hypothetical protein
MRLRGTAVRSELVGQIDVWELAAVALRPMTAWERCMREVEHVAHRRSGCAYRKSNPSILMVQSAQDRMADYASGCLGGA